MIANDFETPPIFQYGAFLSAYDLSVLQSDIAYLDQMSYRRQPLFPNLSRNQPGEPNTAGHAADTFLIWRGGLIMRTGYTTLWVFYRRTGAIVGGARLQVNINGVSRATIVPASGDGQTSISLVGQSYADGSPLLIEISATGLGASDQTSSWWVKDVGATPAYISGPPLSDPSLPIIGQSTPKPLTSAARPWIQMTDFAHVWDQTKLNILSNNILHLYDKMNQVPMIGGRAYRWAELNHNLVTDSEVWTGTAVRATSVDIFRMIGAITVFSGTDTLKVYMEDVLAGTLGPYGVGTTSISAAITYPSAIPVGNRIRVRVTTTTSVQRVPSLGSRLNVTLIRNDPANGRYPAMALSESITTGPLYSSVAVNALLNKFTSALNQIKARVDSSAVFTMVRATRDNYGYDAGIQHSVLRTFPMVFQRRGSRLVVYGKNVVLGFGGTTFELAADGITTTYKYKFVNETNIIQGDKFEMKTIYLDAVKGLYAGDLYFLIGDQYVAYEYMK